jgi:hypothetical protein
VRIFKTKWFERYARRERIADASLKDAIVRAERGLVDADLGGGIIIKQRVARAGRRRSGGYRTLLAYRAGKRAVLLYGFAKSERENIAPDELETLREIGAAWLEADATQIAGALKGGRFAGGGGWRNGRGLAGLRRHCWRRPTTCDARA